MIQIGIVGLGFMGMTHFRGAKKVKGGKVSAICTRDPRKLKGNWQGIRGNFGNSGGQEDLSGIKTYCHIEDILADPEIDLLDICLPSPMHCEVAIEALRTGKNVLVEKPISLNIEDADRMIREADQLGQILMVAHVLPFFPEFSYLKNLISEETYGTLLGGHFKRIISQPDWSADLGKMELTGGPGVDLHIHDTHYISLLCGIPDCVTVSGRLVENFYAEYLSTTYHYINRPDLCITCACGAISQAGRAFTHGFEVYLEKATVIYESSTLNGQSLMVTPLTLLTEDGKVWKPTIGSSDPVAAFTKELQAAVNVVSGGKEIPELTGCRARDALRLCFKEVESVRLGGMVKVS